MNPKMTDNISRAFLELGATQDENALHFDGKSYYLNPYHNIGTAADRYVFDASVDRAKMEGESLSYFVNVPDRTCVVLAWGYHFHFAFSSYRDLVARMVDDAQLRDGLKHAKIRRDHEQAQLDWFFGAHATDPIRVLSQSLNPNF